MKKFNRVLIAILVIVFVSSFGCPIVIHAATNPNLGVAATFSVLASTAITGTPTSISGDVGMNNFSSNITGVAGPVVGGTIYATDAIPVAPGEAVLNATVQANASTAYGTTAGLPIEGTPIVVTELNGLTISAGVYDIPGNATLAPGGVLTLNGSGTYIFRTDPSHSLTSAGTINFTNGARPCDLFWNIGTAADIGGTSFAGTILASTGIHFTNAGVALDGRALAVGADVTLNVGGSISGPTCPAPVASPTLNVKKHVVIDNGGIATANAWTMTVASSNGGTGTGSALGSEAGTLYTLQSGKAYSVVESGGPAGYFETDSADCNIANAVAGTAYTCTITNDDIAPTLVVNKVIVNDDGGTKLLPSDFSLKLDGGAVTHGAVNTTTIGLHTVSETADAGYASAIGGNCATDGTITLALGDIKTCTITNDDIAVVHHSSGGSYTPPVPPLIDVVKVPSPLALPAGPGVVTYTYTLKNTGIVPVTDIKMLDDSCSPLVLISGDTNIDSKLDVTETWVYNCSTTLAKTHTNIVTATGWANGISTTDIASATVVVGASIVPPLIHVTKIPSSLALIGGGVVTYKYTVTNPGTVPLSNVSIVDDKCTGLPGRVLGHPGDLNKNNLLESNESWSFTCKSNLTKTTTNTATASGSANGLTAKDFAIATVVVTNVPGLPKTGFGPENYISWNIIIPAGILGILISFYFARKKQTN